MDSSSGRDVSSNPPATPLSIQGFVDGRPVRFDNDIVSSPIPPRLAWRYLDHADSTALERSPVFRPWDGAIDGKDIIAILDDQSNAGPDNHSFHVYFISTDVSESQHKETASGPRMGSISAANGPVDVLNFHRVSALPRHLLQTAWDEPDIHVVISTLSGSSQAASYFSSVVQPLFTALKSLHFPLGSYSVHHTQSAETVSQLTTTRILPRAQQGFSQTIILLSGDGGVHDLINALLPVAQPTAQNNPGYLAPVLSLVALGTGNALAHSLRLTSTSNALGLRALLFGAPQPLPLFRATFSPGAQILAAESRSSVPVPTAPDSSTGIIHGAVVLSYGLHATLVSDSDTTAYRAHGASRFGLAARDLLFPSDGSSGPHAYRASLVLTPHSAQARAVPGPSYSYILLTLVSNLEQTFTISPRSRPLDGVPRVVHMPPLEGQQLADIMQAAYRGGEHIHDPNVAYEQVEAMRIDFREEDARWRRVCVDGKIVRVEEGGWVEVRRKEGRIVDVVIE